MSQITFYMSGRLQTSWMLFFTLKFYWHRQTETITSLVLNLFDFSHVCPPAIDDKLSFILPIENMIQTTKIVNYSKRENVVAFVIKTWNCYEKVPEMSVSPADREFVRASDGLLFTFLSASLSASLSADAVVGFGLLELAAGCDFACLVLLDMIKFSKKTNLINVKFYNSIFLCRIFYASLKIYGVSQKREWTQNWKNDRRVRFRLQLSLWNVHDKSTNLITNHTNHTHISDTVAILAQGNNWIMRSRNPFYNFR